MKQHSQLLRLLCGLFILLNAAIFVYVNQLPISWTNDEILWQGAFWSESPDPEHTLHTGFSQGDMLKPFNIYHADGTFRTRQVSYFLEMLSFKFWQNWEAVFLRNYTLIGIHLLNCLLAGMLIFFLTRCRKTAMISSVLLLNCGAALASLLYPFRNAKLLAMSFFLLGWIILAKDNKELPNFSCKRLFGFFLVTLLALLTDEISFFFFPILFGYLAIKNGFRQFITKKFILGGLATLLLFFLLTSGAYHISVNIIDATAHTGEQSHYLKSLGNYLTNPTIFKDIAKAFTFYFLRRNYGYWDTTPLGALAFLASLGLLLFIFLFRPPPKERNISFLILLFIFIKAVLFPHNAGYHRVFMPEGTAFPSLFFFSYYYIYAEAVLFALITALLLKNAAGSQKKYVLMLSFVFLISLSNAIHLKDGPQDALKFMLFDKGNKENPQGMVQKVSAVKKILSDRTLTPVYLSFPVGDSGILLAKRNDPFNNLYARMIPFRHLKSLEKGTAISSLKNIKGPQSFSAGEELTNAKSFYDVISQESHDIESLITQYGKDALMPVIATKDSIKTQLRIIPNSGIDHILFFIKGRSGFLLQYGEERLEGQQNYGQAYQVFKINNLPVNPKENPPVLRLSILPVGNNKTSYLIGPFVILKK